MKRVLFIATTLFVSAGLIAQEPIFSGPQKGEKLTGFKIRGALGDQAGKEFDPVAAAGGKPIALVFVHKRTRPSLGLTRALTKYIGDHAKEGLVGAVVLLDDDATETEKFVKRAINAMPTEVPVGVSLNGSEGPGAYGLNRNVELTVLVAKDNMVRASFALVQPSIQADGVRIAKEMAEASGVSKTPTLADLGVGSDGKPAPDRAKKATDRAKPATDQNVELNQHVRALIQLEADEKAVQDAAAAIEKLIASDAEAKKQLVERLPKIKTYGTPAAQKVIKAWSEKYGAKADATPEKKDK